MINRRLIGLLSSMLLLSACSGGASTVDPTPQVLTSAAWPMPGGNPARTGCTELLGPLPAGGKAELAPDWTYFAMPLPSGAYTLCSQPVIDNLGNIYFATDSQVISLAASGVQRWALHMDQINAYGYLPTDCSPLIIGDSRLAFTDGVGNVWAYDFDGQLSWERHDLSQWGAQLAADDSRLYIAHGGTLYAFSHAGQPLWETAVPDGIEDLTAPAVSPDGAVLLRDRSSRFVAIGSSGELLWTYPTELDWNEHWNHSVYSDGLWLIPSPGGLEAIAADGTPAWNYLLPDTEVFGFESAAPAVSTDGVIYLPTAKYNYQASLPPGQIPPILVALDHDGNLIWEYKDSQAQYFIAAGPLVIDGAGRIYLNTNIDMIVLNSQGEKLGWIDTMNADISGAEHVALGPNRNLVIGYHGEEVSGYSQ